MKIKPELSSVREFLTTKLGSRVPIVDTSEAETVVRVKDGAMILIAGLTKKTDTETRNEVPFLAKIPVLGIFFRNVSRGPDEPRHKEFIVFLTPRIISGNVPFPREEILADIALKKPAKGFKGQ
jgi:type II secretory pathway component GspD/PulD (secretin)